MSKGWRDAERTADDRENGEPTSTPGKRTLVESESRARLGWLDTRTLSPGKRTLAQGLPVARFVQRKSVAAESTPDPIATAQHGTSGASGPLPHLDRIQRSFGRHDISSVRAHQDANAADASESLGASAFAHGNAVAFRWQPDLHTAAHEAAHVVQQRSGVQLKGEIDEPGDEYEREADRVADAVVAGESAEPLLDRYAAGSVGPAVVQRDGANKVRTTTTPDFVNQWGTKIVVAIMERIAAHPPANPHPRLTWVTRERAASELGLARGRIRIRRLSARSWRHHSPRSEETMATRTSRPFPARRC